MKKLLYDVNKWYDRIEEPTRLLIFLIPLAVFLFCCAFFHHPIVEGVGLIVVLAIRMAYIHNLLDPK